MVLNALPAGASYTVRFFVDKLAKSQKIVIKMMLNTGNSIDAIAKVTGLPVEEIQKFI